MFSNNQEEYVMKPLKFIICSGSLSERLRFFLRQAGYPVLSPDRRGYVGRSVDGRIEFWERDRRMVPYLVASGYDAGVTGYDLVLDSCINDLRSVVDLQFSRATNQPTRWVLAGPAGKDFRQVQNLRVGCELANLPQLLLQNTTPLLNKFTVVKIEGKEEMAIEEGLCDLVLVVTETGATLRERGLVILPDCEK